MSRECRCCGEYYTSTPSAIGNCAYCYEHCVVSAPREQQVHNGVTAREFEEYRNAIIEFDALLQRILSGG